MERQAESASATFKRGNPFFPSGMAPPPLIALFMGNWPNTEKKYDEKTEVVVFYP